MNAKKSPPLALSRTGTVHLVSDTANKTICGQKVNHETGWMYTNADEGVERVCRHCQHAGLEVWKPKVEFVCSECRETLTRDVWVDGLHWHAEPRTDNP